MSPQVASYDNEHSTYARVPSAFDYSWAVATSPADSASPSSSTDRSDSTYSSSSSSSTSPASSGSVSFAEIFEINSWHYPMFAHELSTLHEQLRTQPACESLREVVQPEAGNVSVVVLQTWTSRRAWKTALKSAPYVRFLSVTRPYLVYKRQVVYHTTISAVSSVVDDTTAGWQSELAKMDTLWVTPKTENFNGVALTESGDVSLDMLLR